jgi:D-xylose transport system ATP-binding protein
MSTADVPVLSVERATKRFGAVTALSDVSITLRSGEILALLGDNGAGKSTLIKAVSGFQQLDEGEIRIAGRPAALKSPHEARRLGIETVYQDLALFDNLSVVANFFAGREFVTPRRCGSAGFLRERRMAAAVEETLRSLDVNIPNPRAPAGLLSGGQRQAIAVARAVNFARRVVILDEPTAALGVRETRNVQRLIKRLPGRGVSVILISHSLEQVMDVADRAIVLRGGRKVGELGSSPENHEQIVALIVGSQAVAG